MGLLRIYVTVYERIRGPVYEWLKPRGILKVRAQGLDFFVRGEDYVISSNLLTYGIWEKEETYFLLNRLRAGMKFLDIGANFGYYTLLAGRAVGDSGYVYAFEPEQRNFELLEMNIRANHLTNAMIFKKAVSNQTGSEQLFVSGKNLGGHTLRKDNVSLGCDGSEQVETTRLDDFWVKQKKPAIDYIKIDTQGAEGVILESAQDMLKNTSPALLIEFWPHGLRSFGTDPGALLRKLENLEYVVQILDGKNLVSPGNHQTIFDLAEKRNYVMLLCEKKSACKNPS